MIKKLQIRRGLKEELDQIKLSEAELGYTTDKKDLYVGTGVEHIKQLNIYDISTNIGDDKLNNSKVASAQAVYDFVDSAVISFDPEDLKDIHYIKEVFGWKEVFLGELMGLSAIFIGNNDFVLVKSSNNVGENHSILINVKELSGDTQFTVCDDVILQYEHSLQELIIGTYGISCNMIDVFGVDTELRAASKVAYDNTLSGLQATTIQAAIDELFEEMQFISDTVDMGGFDDPIHGEIDLGEWE